VIDADGRGHDGAAATMDMLLADAALSTRRRWFPGVAGARFATRLAMRPDRAARRGLGLAAEMGRIALGRSSLAPAKGDRRFKDPAWAGNPGFRRLAQAYLAAGRTVDELISDTGLDTRAERRVRFAVENVLDAAAPTNFPLTNPAVLKATLDDGGANLVRGSRALLRDLSRPPRIPSMVDKSAFEVGENVAVTPGAVVLRTPVFELLQYQPATPKVRETPLLLVPPMINKYYVADMAPGRSMIEYFAGAGQQVFAMSWRNPGDEAAGWGLDTYAQAVLDALEAVETITRVERSHVLGLCAGGITLATVVAHLAAQGEQERIAGMTLGVCVIDNADAGRAGALIDRPTAAAAVADSYRRGYLDGRSLAGVFAWLRPNDLVWGYWVNNYLLGKEPPAFDILYWNADTTNMPAALHRDFLELALSNSLVQAGERSVLGTPVDLGRITVDTYLVAGIADHITPWQSCYRTTQLLGSAPRFVLSNSGHIAAMVNPPGNDKASYRIAEQTPEEADAWLESAAQRKGTWWEDYLAWLRERSGDEKRAPRKLGGRGLQPLEPAPGSYVRG
jgi:polyhydroxyalkanoate synthase subunit PhaC